MNVSIVHQIHTAENGGEYLELLVRRSASTVASTSDGRYYIRVDDACKPVLPDELLRLSNDRSAFLWETNTALKVPRHDFDGHKLDKFILDIQHSDRVSRFVKEKNTDELLEYYLLAKGDYLTNLGVLWVGKRAHRANLLYAPSVQFIKYDELDRKVNKITWDDYSLNPKELLQAIWTQAPDWKEGI
jgi:ATP-dependent DNA helicase RecG